MDPSYIQNNHDITRNFEILRNSVKFVTNTLIYDRLLRVMQLTLDLFDSLKEEEISHDLPDLPSNTIKGQVWCIIGARESYYRAVEHGQWQGFSCSLSGNDGISRIRELLDVTGLKFKTRLDGSEMTADQLAFIFDLLEHEVQHHGQLIRYIYANKLSFPESWNNRYAV